MSSDAPDSLSSSRELQRNLRRRSIQGGAAIVSLQGARFLLNLGTTAVLARHLSPNDFGLIAMVVTVSSFVSMFRDMGLATATIQKEELSHEQSSTMFWLMLAIGVVLMLGMAIATPVVAWFYQDSRLTQIVPLFAFGFLFSGLMLQHRALLRREMDYTTLALAEMVSLVVSVVVAVWMALAGFTYWALVGRYLSEQAVLMVGVWVASAWRPGRGVWDGGVRSMIKFGGNLASFNILSYLSRNLDNVLLGWRWGTGVLGLYDNAYRLLYLPIQQINTPVSDVAISALSRLQDDAEKYRAYYRRGLMLATSAGMPIVGFMLVSTDKIVLAILGEQWLDVVPIFRVLGPAVFLGTFNVATGWAYISLGQTARQLRWQLIGSTAMSIAFFVGLPWKGVGVAAACSITTLLLRYPATAYCFRGTCLRMVDVLQPLWLPTYASIGSGFITYGLSRTVLRNAGLGWGLAAELVVYGLAYFLLWWVIPAGRSGIHQVLEMVREIRGRNGNES